MKLEKTFLIFYIACWSCCFCSCTYTALSDTTGEIITVNLDAATDTAYLSTFIENIEKIRIQLPEKYVWGWPTEILFSENDIFIKDEKTKLLFRFSKNGEFLNTIGSRGNGPGEFVSLTSCFLNGNNVFINDLRSRRISRYAFDGKLIETISYPTTIVYDDIVCLPNELFLCYSPSPIHENSNGLWILNNKGERGENIFPEKRVYPYMNSQWNDLYTLKDENFVGIYYPPTSTHYTLNKSNLEIKPTYQQKTKVKTLADYQGTKSVMDIREDYAHCPMSVHSNNWIFSLWSISGGKPLYSIYSKKEKENVNYKNIKNDFPGYNFFGLPVSTNLSNSMVSILTDEYSKSFFPDEDQKTGITPGTAVIQIMTFK